jgi:hypothetical protein
MRESALCDVFCLAVQCCDEIELTIACAYTGSFKQKIFSLTFGH